MNLVDVVYNALLHRYNKDAVKNALSGGIYTLNELQAGFEYIFRSKFETRNKEKAILFVALYNMIRDKSQYPSFGDPFNGMVPKKVKDINEFINEYSNSIFSFVPYIKEVIDNDN